MIRPFIFLPFLLAGCSLTSETMQTIEINAAKDVGAAGVGYLTGGKAGAVAGLMQQVIRNHPVLTSAKNPFKVRP